MIKRVKNFFFNFPVALTVVRKIMNESESIMGVLKKTGLSFEQIAVAAPRLQASLIFFN